MWVRCPNRDLNEGMRNTLSYCPSAFLCNALFRKEILDWVLSDQSAQTFRPLWRLVTSWQCYFHITDGWAVYSSFISEGDQIVSKTYMTRVEGESTRLRHYLTRLRRKTLCYSKSIAMLTHTKSA